MDEPFTPKSHPQLLRHDFFTGNLNLHTSPFHGTVESTERVREKATEMMQQLTPEVPMATAPLERPVSGEQKLPEPTPAPPTNQQTTMVPPPSLTWKRSFDFTIALLLFLLSWPILLLAALLVKLTSQGPAFYCQVRLGLNGKPFWIYKLRSMVIDSESKTGACWSTPGDPRVTWFGHFLRRTHLDELPQLWNVLKGDMSLVGPRPERPEFVPRLEKAIPRYRERMQIRPGVTGLAQIQLPPDSDFGSVRRKLRCDLDYIQKQSFWLDLRIILATALKVVGIGPRWRCRLLGIPQRKDSENPAGPCAQTV